MACVCSQFSMQYGWLILGHYSPKMPMGPLQACKDKAKKHIQTTYESQMFSPYRKISCLGLASRSQFEIFP